MKRLLAFAVGLLSGAGLSFYVFLTLKRRQLRKALLHTLSQEELMQEIQWLTWEIDADKVKCIHPDEAQARKRAAIATLRNRRLSMN